MSNFCGIDYTQNKTTYQQFIKNIQFCTKHNRRPQFICLQKRCQSNLIVCVECMSEHNGHEFHTIQKYFYGERFDLLCKGQSKKHKHFEDLTKLVKKKLIEIQEAFHKQMNDLKAGIDDAMVRLKQVGAKVAIKDAKIDQKKMLTIKKYLQSEWTYNRCQRMKQCFDKVLNAVQDSYANISGDLYTFIEEEDWEQIIQPEYVSIQERYFKHLHNHKEKIVDYFKFDADLKAPNIKLKDGRLVAVYTRNSPSTPFVLCDNYVSAEKNKWIIEVQQCDAKMLFFNATIFYIGICKPDTAKRMNYCGLNQGGRGAYLIGSNGWSYHHTSPNYDRQDMVGFTFGKGDKIQVSVDFSANGRIRFKKLGKIYDNKFQMSLDMDAKQFKNIKPCIGFHQQLDAQVKIINFP